MVEDPKLPAALAPNFRQQKLLNEAKDVKEGKKIEKSANDFFGQLSHTFKGADKLDFGKKPLRLDPLPKTVATPQAKKDDCSNNSASDIDQLSVDDLKALMGKGNSQGVRDSQQSQKTSVSSIPTSSINRSSIDSNQSLLLFDPNEIVDENCMVAQMVK